MQSPLQWISVSRGKCIYTCRNTRAEPKTRTGLTLYLRRNSFAYLKLPLRFATTLKFTRTFLYRTQQITPDWMTWSSLSKDSGILMVSGFSSYAVVTIDQQMDRLPVSLPFSSATCIKVMEHVTNIVFPQRCHMDPFKWNLSFKWSETS